MMKRKAASIMIIAVMIVHLLPPSMGRAEEASKKVLADNLAYERMSLDKMLKEGTGDDLVIVLKDGNHEDYEYQWEYRSFEERNSDEWEELNAEKNDYSYRIDSLTEDNTGEYRCRIKEKSGTDAAEVVFTRSLKLSLSWEDEENWEDTYTFPRYPGTTQTLSLAGLKFESGAVVGYRWWFGTKLLNGATGKNLSVNLESEADFGTYVCEVNLIRNGKIVSIKKQEMYIVNESEIRCTGNNKVVGQLGKTINLGIEDVEYEPSEMKLTYQWKKYDESTKTSKDIPGAVTNPYALNINSEKDYGTYLCVVSGKVGSRVYCHDVFEMEVISKLELSMEFEEDIYLSPGDNFDINTKLIGDANDYRIEYQWYKGSPEEKNKISGETKASIALTIKEPGDYGLYYCEAKVYDGNTLLFTLNCHTEVICYLSYEFDPVYSEKEPAAVMIKDSITLEAPRLYNWTYGYKESYQWYKLEGGVYQKIEGAVSAKYTLKNQGESSEGDQYCVEALLSKNGVIWGGNVKSYFSLCADIGMEINTNGNDEFKFWYKENGVLPAMEADIKCDPQFESKLSYQWQGTDEDYGHGEYTDIKGADSKIFTPTKNQERLYNAFRCVVSVGMKGYPPVYTRTNLILGVNEVIDLTDGKYADRIEAEDSSIFYTRKFVAPEESKGIQFTWNKSSDTYRYSDYYFTGSNGKQLSFSSYLNSEAEGIMVEGNIVYVTVYHYGIGTMGFKSVTGAEDYKKSAYKINYTQPDKDYYLYGEKVDLTGLTAKRHYTDGTAEEIKLSELSYETDTKQMKPGYYELAVTDTVSGIRFIVEIEIDMADLVVFGKRPPDVLFRGSKAAVSVKGADNGMTEDWNYLWVMKDANGKTIDYVGDDTSSEFTIPDTLPSARYQLLCYYYQKGGSFDANQYIAHDFQVVSDTLFTKVNTLPESSHPVPENRKTYQYYYQIPGAGKLAVSFDERTEQYYWDEFYIMGKDGIGYRYSAEDLAGKTIEIEGDTVYIYAVYEDSMAWGFKVTDIKDPLSSPTPPPVIPPIVKPAASPGKHSPVNPANPANRKIQVKKAKIIKITAKKKALTIKLKKFSGIKGNQIVYSADKRFKKSVKTKLTNKTTVQIKKLKPKKKYYIKVRAYKLNAKKKKVYGKYSAVKSKKTK